MVPRNEVGRVSSTVWVGEKQLGGRTGGVMVTKGAVRLSSTAWVGEKQLGGRTGEVVLRKAIGWVRLA